MKQNILNIIAFKILVSYSILVMTNHLKPNQDRLEFRVYIIKKSSRRSIIYLEDIYIWIVYSESIHTHTHTHIYTFLNFGTGFCLPLYKQVENFRNVYIFLQISTHQTTNAFEDMRIFFTLIFAQNLFTLFFASLYLFTLRSIHKYLFKWTSTLTVLCWDSFLFKIKMFYINYSNLGGYPTWHVGSQYLN